MGTLRPFTAAMMLLLALHSSQATTAEAQEIPGASSTLLGLVGQVTNSAAGVTPATSIQYGYLNFVRGIGHLSAAGKLDESNALFTFFNDTTTVSVVTVGNLRTVIRQGTATVYLDLTPNGNFADPNTFRDGTPILTARLQQEVVVDTVSGTFRTLNVNSITSTAPFMLDGRRLQIGTAGDALTTFLVGHPSPPSAGAFSAYVLEGRGTLLPTSPVSVSAMPLIEPEGGQAVSASFVVSFPSAMAGHGMVLFGSGPGCTGLVSVATRDLFSNTTMHSVVVTGNDLPGTVGDIGITPGATYSYEVLSVGGGTARADDNNGACYQVTIPAR